LSGHHANGKGDYSRSYFATNTWRGDSLLSVWVLYLRSVAVVEHAATTGSGFEPAKVSSFLLPFVGSGQPVATKQKISEKRF